MRGAFLLEEKLSRRQKECLGLVAQGYTSKEIARKLSISPSTVDNHIKAAIDKTGARNRLDAARTSLRFSIERGGADPRFRMLDQLGAEDENRVVFPPNDKKVSLFSLLPLGGQVNNLPVRQRIFHIVQIAIIAVLLVSGTILTIAGVVHILGNTN